MTTSARIADLLKRRYMRGSEVELQNALHNVNAVSRQMREALDYALTHPDAAESYPKMRDAIAAYDALDNSAVDKNAWLSNPRGIQRDGR